MSINWNGVIPALTTKFTTHDTLDLPMFGTNLDAQVEAGVTGVIIGGSLGEASTLELEEKETLIKFAVERAGHQIAVLLNIAEGSTREAIRQAKLAKQWGARGLMVLPPYGYTSDWYEMKQHVSTVICATKLECMLYNNPVAYGTDFTPEHIAELAREHENFRAVKESSTDTRRLSAIRALIGNRIALSIGVDDGIVDAGQHGYGEQPWCLGLCCGCHGCFDALHCQFERIDRITGMPGRVFDGAAGQAGPGCE